MAERKTNTTIEKLTKPRRTVARVSAKKTVTRAVKSPIKKTVRKKTVSKSEFAREYPMMQPAQKEVATPRLKSFTRSASSSHWHKKTYHPFGEHSHLPHHHSFGVLAVLALVLAGVFLYLGLRPGLEISVPELSFTRAYQSEKHQFKFEYPAMWRVSEFVVGEGEDKLESVVLQNGSHSIVIYTTREVSEETLVPGSSYVTTINGLSATRYRDYDPQTGLLLERVVIESPDGLLHELRGYGPLFERVVNSFSLEAN